MSGALASMMKLCVVVGISEKSVESQICFFFIYLLLMQTFVISSIH